MLNLTKYLCEMQGAGLPNDDDYVFLPKITDETDRDCFNRWLDFEKNTSASSRETSEEKASRFAQWSFEKKKKEVLDFFTGEFEKATSPESQMDIVFAKDSQVGYKINTKIAALRNIMMDSKSINDRFVGFYNTENSFYFEVAGDDIQKRDQIINTVLDKMSLFDRKRGCIQGRGLSKIESLTTIDQLQNFMAGVGDFDEDGQNFGWGFFNNKLRLFVNGVFNVQIQVFKFVSGSRVEILGDDKEMFL